MSTHDDEVIRRGRQYVYNEGSGSLEERYETMRLVLSSLLHPITGIVAVLKSENDALSEEIEELRRKIRE